MSKKLDEKCSYLSQSDCLKIIEYSNDLLDSLSDFEYICDDDDFEVK